MPDAIELNSCRVRVVDVQLVTAVRAQLPRDDVITDLTDILGLLGDRTRLKILVALLQAGEMCVCDLAAVTRQAESTVSHALRLLRAHRAVKMRRQRRMAYYRLDDVHVQTLLEVGLAHSGHANATPSAVATTGAAYE